MTTAPGRRATLATIAAAAGVSMPTVSKVLNGRTDVAPATRARVEQLLGEHNYVPVKARNRGADVLVDLVFPALDSPWALEIISGVVASGLDVVVSAIGGTPDRAWVQKLVRAERSGLILVTAALTAADRGAIERARIPLVIVDPLDIPGPEVPSVGATNWGGGLAATEHLIALGHTRIAMIAGPASFLCSRARVDGYRSGLAQAGLPVDPSLIRFGDFHHRGGYREACELLALPDRPTAIFAGSDEQALGAVEAARVAGLAVPGDVSVVGFDDLPVARWSSPPLTTVRQPLSEMGRLAGRMVKRLMDGEVLESERVELATRLVVRASTAPPRAV